MENTICVDLSGKEINWLIETLEYYLEESETAEDEKYQIEIDTLLDKLLNMQKYSYKQQQEK